MKKTTFMKILSGTAILGIIVNVIANILIPIESAIQLLWLCILMPVTYIGVAYGFRFAGIREGRLSAAIITSPYLAYIPVVLLLNKFNLSAEMYIQLASRALPLTVLISIIIFECVLYCKIKRD